ncbi:DNA cytosine methyltransferase [Streptomyces sp. BI20]|uniref:DNA cytosine methyltransferase n=1 Tax=Streptomyces sp. BI20 TaxID=3403460 RepID=UPI003C7210A9
MKRTSVELFAGGGGLVQASTKAGFRHLLLNEFAPRACETLEANGFEGFAEGVGSDVLEKWLDGLDERRGAGSGGADRGPGAPLVKGDVRALDMRFLAERDVDLLAGGPPCQPFSLGGVAKGDEDARNMFPEMFRAVREIRPKAVICENVRGLVRPSFVSYFEYIERELGLPFVERREGATWREHDAVLRERHDARDADPARSYEVRRFQVNAAEYGVPQVRNRVILVAFRKDLGVDYDAFERDAAPTHSQDALTRALLTGAYWDDHTKVPGHVRDRVAARFADQLPLEDGDPLPRWLTLRDALAGLPEIDRDLLDKRTEQGGIADHVGWPGARIYDGHTPNELDKPAKTVKAGVHGVPGGESVMLLDELNSDGTAYEHRYMTVRETARVMTFDDDWKLAGPRGERMRQLGNAVPVLLGKAFAKAVSKALDDAERRSRKDVRDR